jgi:integrase
MLSMATELLPLDSLVYALKRIVPDAEWLLKHIESNQGVFRLPPIIQKVLNNPLLGQLPEHTAEMMRFALATGLRQRNACRLEWSAVDLERRCAWVHADQTKTRKAIAVSLNVDAMAVLSRRQGIHATWVFTFKGQPVWQVNTKAWRKAVQRAGLEDFRWHDLRHTWASRHAQAGTPLNVLQEARRLALSRDGAAVCAPVGGASARACRAHRSARRKWSGWLCPWRGTNLAQ